MQDSYSIQETNSELENLPIKYPAIYNRNKNKKIVVFSIWSQREYKLKDLNMVNILKYDLLQFKNAYKEDKDNEGIQDQIVRIESMLFDLGELEKKSTFGYLFGKKEYPIHIIVKKYTLIFS